LAGHRAQVIRSTPRYRRGGQPRLGERLVQASRNRPYSRRLDFVLPNGFYVQVS